MGECIKGLPEGAERDAGDRVGPCVPEGGAMCACTCVYHPGRTDTCASKGLHHEHVLSVLSLIPAS